MEGMSISFSLQVFFWGAQASSDLVPHLLAQGEGLSVIGVVTMGLVGSAQPQGGEVHVWQSPLPVHNAHRKDRLTAGLPIALFCQFQAD